VNEHGEPVPRSQKGGQKEATSVAALANSLRQKASLPKYKVPADAPAGYKPPDPEEARRRYVPIPANYTSPETSGLTYLVKRGKQEDPIELK
jgi:hypothetical protein